MLCCAVFHWKETLKNWVAMADDPVGDSTAAAADDDGDDDNDNQAHK